MWHSPPFVTPTTKGWKTMTSEKRQFKNDTIKIRISDKLKQQLREALKDDIYFENESHLIRYMIGQYIKYGRKLHD